MNGRPIALQQILPLAKAALDRVARERAGQAAAGGAARQPRHLRGARAAAAGGARPRHQRRRGARSTGRTTRRVESHPDEAAWTAFLAKQGATPESFRAELRAPADDRRADRAGAADGADQRGGGPRGVRREPSRLRAAGARTPPRFESVRGEVETGAAAGEAGADRGRARGAAALEGPDRAAALSTPDARSSSSATSSRATVASRPCAGSRSRSRRGSASACSARTARARRRPSRSWRACSRRPRARSRCSAGAGGRDDQEIRERLGVCLQQTVLSEKLRGGRDARALPRLLPRGPAPAGRGRGRGPAGEGARPRRHALGRPEAAAGRGLRARGRPGAAVPRRAHDRARPAVAAAGLGDRERASSAAGARSC